MDCWSGAVASIGRSGPLASRMSSFVLGAGAVIGLNLYAAVLIVLRGLVFRTRIYRPMLLNIGLSLVPLLVALGLVVGSLVLASGPELGHGLGTAALLVFLLVSAAVWILFFPNSIYLITELNFTHRRSDDPVPLWYDIVQTLTLSLSGIANAIAGLSIIQLFSVVVFGDPNVTSTWPPPRSWLVMAAVLVLGSFGIYLGRYLRFNSWDVRHPSSMITKIRGYFDSASAFADAAGFVVAHTVMVAILYVPIFTATYLLLTQPA